MVKIKLYNGLVFLLFIFVTAILSGQQIIPSPKEIILDKGNFVLENEYDVKTDVEDNLDKKVKYLKDQIEFATQLTSSTYKSGVPSIEIVINKALKFGEEGYQLNVQENGVLLEARNEKGVLNAMTTLVQLVYEFKEFGRVVIPALSIKDEPKYAWRSFMLDSGRQYHSLSFIKKYLNQMALLKMNIFHWHLTENDGWRIEIKQYPRLTEVGAHVTKGNEQQGFYTQEEIKEIIEYASILNIEVVPEIDVPGHSNAAIAAYPKNSCLSQVPDNTTYKVHSPYIFCAGKESAYTFIENIMDEVFQLFPSNYIHLGGDEASKDHWAKCSHCQKAIKTLKLNNEAELQLYFSKRLANYAKSKSKKVIFWNDVLIDENSVLPDNCVIQWWNYRSDGTDGLDWSIKNDIPVIASTNYYTYLFFPVTLWAGCNENRTFDMKQAYEENPSDIKNPHPLVMGMSASLWGDFNGQQYMADRKVFPRIYALAEQMWSLAERPSFENFYTIVKVKYKMLEYQNVDYGPALKEETPLNYKWQ